jgi:hypothetical protein
MIPIQLIIIYAVLMNSNYLSRLSYYDLITAMTSVTSNVPFKLHHACKGTGNDLHRTASIIPRIHPYTRSDIMNN